MQTLTEKRVFGAKSGTTAVYVASEVGLVVAAVSADRLGTFGLAHRGPVSALALAGDRVVIGVDEGVLVSDVPDAPTVADDYAFEPLATDSIAADPVGRVVAAGDSPVGPLVADADGGVFVFDADSSLADRDDGWQHVGTVEDVRAIDGGLLAAADGVHRLTGGGVVHAGLTDARDVAGHGVPLAATAAGLFRLGNGWLAVHGTPVDRVAADGHGHAIAVGPEGLRRHDGRVGADVGDGRTESDAGWVADDLPVDSPVVDVAYGGGLVAAVTADGTLGVDAGDGWRCQPLGVRGSRALAVGRGQPNR